MPIRNMWSLNPGEVLTAEKLREHVPECEVYFPMKDVGVDLLVVSGNSHVGLQVKESRYYSGKGWHNSWHQVSESNLETGSGNKKKLPDFFVFLTHHTTYEEGRKPSFVERYLVVPLNELLQKIKNKKLSKGKYSFQFEFRETRVFDTREGEDDYTEFLGKWELISKALEEQSSLAGV